MLFRPGTIVRHGFVDASGFCVAIQRAHLVFLWICWPKGLVVLFIAFQRVRELSDWNATLQQVVICLLKLIKDWFLE